MNSSTQQNKDDPSPDSIDVQKASEGLQTPSTKGFIASTIEELRLVVWPSRQQLFSESIAVILMVALSAAAIAAVSRFYGWGASHIFR